MDIERWRYDLDTVSREQSIKWMRFRCSTFRSFSFIISIDNTEMREQNAYVVYNKSMFDVRYFIFRCFDRSKRLIRHPTLKRVDSVGSIVHSLPTFLTRGNKCSSLFCWHFLFRFFSNDYSTGRKMQVVAYSSSTILDTLSMLIPGSKKQESWPRLGFFIENG